MKLWLILPLLWFSCGLNAAEPNPSTQDENPMKQTNQALATFAGGCFWCMEPPFQALKGVSSVISGYSGGSVKNPTYEQVSSGTTGHLEVIQIHYDPSVVNYRQLLHVFWRQIDPTDGTGSFVDRGNQYRSAIFYHNEEQKTLALAAIQSLNDSKKYDKPIVTDVLPFEVFYPAEDYHQDYSEKNPIRYKYYRYRSGRDDYIEATWGDDADSLPSYHPSEYKKPDEQTLRKTLTPLQYKVTQEEGTEPPFENTYWDNKQAGIYVDVVSGEPLFSSVDKYDSKTGWPSFTRTIKQNAVHEKEDNKLFSTRIEVRSQQGDSHLGHVFPDGPEPTGLRYCINSAALRFIPKADLAKEGYGEYLSQFE